MPEPRSWPGVPSSATVSSLVREALSLPAPRCPTAPWWRHADNFLARQRGVAGGDGWNTRVSRPQQFEDRGDPAVGVTGGFEPEFAEDLRAGRLDGAFADTQGAGDAGVRPALGHQGQGLVLAVGEPFQWGVRATPAQQTGDDRRVKDTLTFGNAPQRVDEHGDVGDPFLEQVSARGRLVGQQPVRVSGLEVLAQHQNCDARVGGANPGGGDQPLVAVGRWHADVDDRDVWLLSLDQPEQGIGLGAFPGHLDVHVRQQARHPRPEEHDVVGDHDPHGIVTSTRGPSSPVTVSTVPPSASTRSRVERDMTSARCPSGAELAAAGWTAARVSPFTEGTCPVRARSVVTRTASGPGWTVTRAAGEVSSSSLTTA